MRKEKPIVLISAPYAIAVLAMYRKALKAAGCEIVVARVRERLEESELLPLVKDISGIICGDDRITAKVLAAAPRLKVISKWGTGIDSIDQDAAAARGIAVRNTPGAFTEPVADTVLGWMLLFARRFDVMDQDMRAGRWVKPQLFSLCEKTLGVVGMGRCGKAVARRALAFGMKVLGHDIREMPQDFIDSTHVEMLSLPELLKRSDFVSLNADLNPSSHHLMNLAAFALMKRGSYLLNAARGPIVKETALIRALRAGRLAGAAMDVYEEEPLSVKSPLRRMKNVHLSPHNANSSPRAAARVHENTIENLITGLGLSNA